MNDHKCNEIMIGLTTVSKRDDAISLIRKLLESKLIACGQIEGPILSVYKWNLKTEQEEEWRISMKFPIEKKENLKEKIKELHPYEIPQWVVLAAQSTKEYHKWVSQ